MCRQVTEIGDSHHFLAYLSRQLQYFLMRTRQKIFQNAQLVHEFKRGRMNGVSAEIPQKIRMLLKHTYIHACPGQKKAQHHAGWSSSGDAAASVDGFGHSRKVMIIVEIRERGRQTNHSPPPHSSQVIPFWRGFERWSSQTIPYWRRVQRLLSIGVGLSAFQFWQLPDFGNSGNLLTALCLYP